MSWRAHGEYSPFTQRFDIRIARVLRDDRAEAVTGAEDGHAVMQVVDPGVEVPPFVSLPQGAVDALTEALMEHRPPPDDADLREALRIERGRVDRLIDSALPGLAGGGDDG